MDLRLADTQSLLIRLGWTSITLLIAWAVGHIVNAVVIARLQAVAERTPGRWDQVVIATLKRRIPAWSLLVGVWLSTSHWPLSAQGQLFVGRLVFVVAAMSITLALAHIASRLIADYGAQISPALPVATLSQNIAWILIVILGVLIVLNGLGLSITPMVTAFGVGGLAVALALQDPLANFFAGILVTLARQVRVGDFIKLDSGVEGEIVDFSWRLTRIRTMGEKIVLVPNAKLAQAIVTNFSLPARELPVAVELGVDAATDLDRVEKAVTDVGRSVMKTVPGGVPESEPIVRYHSVGTSLIKFTVLLRARDIVNQGLIVHEFLKRLHARFQEDGIQVRV